MSNATLHYAVRLVDPVADPQAFAAIAQLHAECLPDDAVLPPTEGLWWIAYHCDKPVAFAGLHLDQPERGTAYLCRAGVTRLHRGQGLQRRLIRARCTKARSLGYRRAVCDAVCDNPHSCNNLIAEGFRMFLPEEPWGLERTCYWSKAL